MTCGLKLVTMGAAILSVVKDRMSPSIPRGPRPSLSSRGALCSAELFDLLPIALSPPLPARAHADSGAFGRTRCLLQNHK